jgi:hypothetical protein
LSLPWSYLHFTYRFKLYLRAFPEAPKHIENELPSLLTDKVASTFSQTFSAPTARIYGPLLMKRSASSWRIVMDSKATNNSRCPKWRFSWSSSQKCRREFFSSHSSWRAKRVYSFRHGKHFRTAELGSGKGRGVSTFYCDPKSVSNLSPIRRASFWWAAFKLAIGHESTSTDFVTTQETCNLSLRHRSVSHYLSTPSIQLTFG